jgi:hypothetical protein
MVFFTDNLWDNGLHFSSSKFHHGEEAESNGNILQ